MSTKDKLFYFSSIPFIAFIYWLMADVLGGWGILAGVMAFFAVGLVVMGACMVAVMAIIYYLTIFRSNRYAKRLRDAGYAVYMNKYQVWEFSVMALVACAFTPIAIFMTGRFWEIHTCIPAGECVAAEGWYFIAPFMGFMIWLLSLLSIWATVSTWWRSFRPLRRYYNDMQLGHTLDLPRLR